MAWYPAATRRELPQNKTQPTINPRSIALHTGVTNQTSLYSFFNGRSQGVESHFYVTATGAVEQYMDTTRRADCQLDGNAYAISIETWDGAGRVWDGRNVSKIPPWNDKQVASLVALMAWICRTHSIPATKCPAWDGRGIGYHAQFTGGAKRWNEHHACPGPARIRQVPLLISATATALAAQAPSGGNDVPYIVARGDTLAVIAKRFGVTVTAITTRNRLADPDHIEVGQRLLIPQPAKPAPKPTGGNMPTAEEIAKAVWTYRIENRDDPAKVTTTKQQAQSSIVNQEATQDQDHARLIRVESKLDELLAKMEGR